MGSIKDLPRDLGKHDKCPKSPNGKHKYETTCGHWPSEERTCKYCKDRYYTK
jgi:hypothetical protein